MLLICGLHLRSACAPAPLPLRRTTDGVAGCRHAGFGIIAPALCLHVCLDVTKVSPQGLLFTTVLVKCSMHCEAVIRLGLAGIVWVGVHVSTQRIEPGRLP